MKLYIAVLDAVPDFITPTLVAHAVLGAHLHFSGKNANYDDWVTNSFKKCVVRVNEREFEKIKKLEEIKQSVKTALKEVEIYKKEKTKLKNAWDILDEL